jgi:hypothetical protein
VGDRGQRPPSFELFMNSLPRFLSSLRFSRPPQRRQSICCCAFEVRQIAHRQGYCFQHVQAIMVLIDQYAEAATGNRDYFLDKPHSISGSRSKGDAPLIQGKRRLCCRL